MANQSAVVVRSFFGDSEAQAALNRIKATLGTDFSDTDVFPYTIVSEAVMSNGNNSYKFPINTKNQDQSLPLQNGLLDSDLFLGYKIAITVDARVSTKPSSVIRWQFGNPNVFNATANTGTATDIESFFNARFLLNVSNVSKIQNLFTNKFRKVGTPAIAGTGASTAIVATEDYANDLKWVQTPIVTLLGADQNEYAISLITGSDGLSIANTATNGQNVVAVMHHGFRVPQGTNAYRAIIDATSSK